MSTENIREVVREKYGKAALQAASGSQACCGGSSCCDTDVDPITAGLYDSSETQELPEEAVLASLGCGNPTALAQLSAGEIVLDLGSGGGIDVLLSARHVGPTGKAYGLDMTDEMLDLARKNQAKAGIENVEFLKGEIEQIPLPNCSVDVIISNCVINLSADKDRVLREAFRVLKPGGRLAVSDVVVRGQIPAEIRKSVELWIGCVAGALEETDYRAKLAAAGFENVDLEPTRIYRAEEARSFLQGSGIDVEAIAQQVDGKFASMFVRAIKPAVTAVTIEVYDPAMCCSTGVCGPVVDPVLPRFSADLEWLTRKGVNVTRFNLAHQPKAFSTNPAVKAALANEGTRSLPIVSVNGEVVSKGLYPDRGTLAGWAGVELDTPGLSLPVLDSGVKSGCCS